MEAHRRTLLRKDGDEANSKATEALVVNQCRDRHAELVFLAGFREQEEHIEHHIQGQELPSK